MFTAKVSDRDDWFDIWEADKRAMIDVMASNMASDLKNGYNFFGKIIQDQILADRQDSSFASGTNRTYSMDPSQCQFVDGSGNAIVELPRVTNRDGTLKWIFAISAVAFDPPTNICTIEITVIDNYRNPGAVLYTYEFSFWVPNMTKQDGTTPIGDRITIEPGTCTTVSGVSNWSIVVKKQ